MFVQGSVVSSIISQLSCIPDLELEHKRTLYKLNETMEIV